MIRFLDLREKLKSSEYACLCVYGNDAWLKRKAVANVCAALNVPDDGFNVDYLQSPALEAVTLACMTPSLFCDRKIVVCEDFVFPDGNKAQGVKKQLGDLIARRDGGFCLIFVADTDKNFDVEGIEKVNCNHLDKDSISKWIVSYCKRQNVEADRLTADKLALYCLNDMARVSLETQKLIDYGEFSADAVDKLVHKDAEYAVYDLSQLIADRKASKATELYRGLVSRGEEPRALFALLYNYYRRVYYVKTSSFSADKLAAYLGVKIGAIGFAKETANKYKPMQLKRALNCFERADSRLKAFVDDNEVMNMLIMQLIAL
ncbi:MAG: DNA polymerase III subunit delta [Corallococcus sp.]|nr:DNA polymerase III subunit delta [Bacillota bacterium]MCM1533686.1 DNA polymerase III subunit delta [Corallococcus sp.]